MALRAFASKTDSPVNRDNAASSRSIVPAQAVQVSLAFGIDGDFMPQRRFMRGCGMPAANKN